MYCVNFGFAQSGTQVNGTIIGDAVWSQAGSPYNLASPVIVSYGTTLTIQAGVTVNLNGYNLQVNGILQARGSNGNNIVFDSSGGNVALTASSSSWNEQAGTGCIIENAVFNNASISVSSTAPKIDNNTINNPSTENGAIYMESGAPIISGNNINGDIQCLDDASPTITNNFIHGGINGEGLDLSAPVIVNNIIEGGTGQMVPGTGIYADGSNYYIANNTIFGCYYGIDVADGRPIIEGNLIINNTDGIALGGSNSVSVTILHNTICNNTVGVAAYQSAGSITVAYNNLVSNGQYTLGGNVTYNWWGTTDQTAIAKMLSSGSTFVPFLASPDPQAPAIPNITTPPSPTPTPSLAISPAQTQTSTADSTANPTPTPSLNQNGITEQPTLSPSQASQSVPEFSTFMAFTALAALLVTATLLAIIKQKHQK